MRRGDVVTSNDPDNRRGRAARTGKGDSQVIDETLRRGLGLGVLEELWSRSEPIAEDEAMTLAIEAQRAARRKQR